MDRIIGYCQEPDEENVSDLRDRVNYLQQQVNSQKETIDLLLERVDKLEHQLHTSAASTAASVTVVTTVTTVANTVTTAAVTTLANTSTATTFAPSTTTSTSTPAPAQQRASYLYSYRAWCRQACLVAGLDVRPIPGRDILIKPTKAYKWYHSDCKSIASPINGYINHLKVVHDVHIRDQTMRGSTAVTPSLHVVILLDTLYSNHTVLFSATTHKDSF